MSTSTRHPIAGVAPSPTKGRPSPAVPDVSTLPDVATAEPQTSVFADTYDSPTLDADVACYKCSYRLRGLSPAGRCPECGEPVMASFIDRPADLTGPSQHWSRLVMLGLVTLILSTPGQMWVVLQMDFINVAGGVATRMNVPAPKIWAVPLMQRSLGHAPEWLGTRATWLTMLSLASVFLITSSKFTSDWNERPLSLRRLARWAPPLLAGGFLGFMMNAEGLYPRDPALPKYSIVGILGVELPCTLLLYAYLIQLSRKLDQPVVAKHLRYVCVAMSLLMFAACWVLWEGSRIEDYRKTYAVQIASSLYTALCMCVALLTLGALSRLLYALGVIAWPRSAVKR